MGAGPEVTVPSRFCLTDVGLFSITADSPVPADQHLLSQKSKGLTSVVGAGFVNYN